MFSYYAVRIYCTMFSCTPLLLHDTRSVPEYQILSQTSADLRIKGHVDLESHPTVWINDGGLKGFQMETLSGKKFAAFQNIPFAQPPTGNLRFRGPVKNSAWNTIRDAISPSPTCLQTDFIQLYNITGTEDCLYLNVYTPKIPKHHDPARLPVMVFIHGGGYFFGSSNLYGPNYMLEESVVLVSMNYRLGPFGFLSTGDAASPGNNGLKDQALALQWVQENIAAFGGDPGQVTLFGESAGASSVQFHMISPLSKGLFHGGISQSGSTFCFWSISERAAKLSREFAQVYNCDSDDSSALVECLRQVDGQALVQGQLKFLEWDMYPVVIFGPVIEPAGLPGTFLTDLPANIYAKRDAAQVPWLTGYNSAEMSLNVASLLLNPARLSDVNDRWQSVGPIWLEIQGATLTPEKLASQIRTFYLDDRNVTFDSRHDAVKMVTDRYLIHCGLKAIQYHSMFSDRPVYAYHLKYQGSYSVVNLVGQEGADWGVAHIDDLIYLMNNTAYYKILEKGSPDYRFSRMMVNLWANFARTGKPFISDLSITTKDQNSFWDPISLEKPLTFAELTLDPKMTPNPFQARMEFWDSLNLQEDKGENDLKSLHLQES